MFGGPVRFMGGGVTESVLEELGTCSGVARPYKAAPQLVRCGNDGEGLGGPLLPLRVRAGLGGGLAASGWTAGAGIV